MFITEEDVLKVKVYFKRKAHTYIAFTQREIERLEYDEEKMKEFQILTLTMKDLTWGLYNELQESALTDNGSGDRVFNYKRFKETRLNRLLVDWDAKDKEGKKPPINPKNISHLAPPIAEAILRAYDDITMIDEDEEKKL